jgi:ketosteroid isomerase-like protein
MADVLGELLDERAISALLNDYARALDTRDWPLLSSLFTAEAVADYTAEGGPLCNGANAIVADCQADFTGLDATHHLIGNVVVTIDGDHATARSYVHAWHHRAEAPGGTVILLAGGYEDRLVRDGDGWKIARRVLTVAFEAGNPAVKAGRVDARH